VHPVDVRANTLIIEGLDDAVETGLDGYERVYRLDIPCIHPFTHPLILYPCP
jgi:hypothetical protein